MAKRVSRYSLYREYDTRVLAREQAQRMKGRGCKPLVRRRIGVTGEQYGVYVLRGCI